MLRTKLQSIPSLFLVANSISWFTLTMITIMGLSGLTSFEKILTVSGSYFGALIFSAIIGATLIARKLKEKGFLSLWILTGVVSCISFYFLEPQATLPTIGILSLMLGGSVGLGIPTCLSMFANQSKTHKLGRMGAVLFFVIQILTAVIFLSLEGTGTEYKFLILSIWRILALVSIIFLKKTENSDSERKTSLIKILKDRTFILYFVPWFMFTLINFVQTPIVELYMGPEVYSNYVLATIIISSFSAIGAGFLCDFKGRKIAGISGFILLGVGYAFLSFLSNGPGNQFGLILFTVFDGLAWGFLYVNFIFVVWGDLSERSNREKYYLLGGMPFLFSGLIQVLVQPFAQFIPIGAAFSFASFFLFLATLPLFFAPESLPDKIIKNRDLSNYVNKALKKVQRGTTTAKEEKAEKFPEKESKNKVEAVESSEDVEARKLAEKYY